MYYTDDYPVYQVLNNYVAGKEYTYTVESHNSYCRAHLARLARDMRAVSKSEGMVNYSLASYGCEHRSVRGVSMWCL